MRRASAISTTNGLTWKEVWKGEQAVGDVPLDSRLGQEVNGAYEVLVKVSLLGKASPADACLKTDRVRNDHMLNSKTQPKLQLGKNTVYVGAGEQTESIVIWPDLQGEKYKPYVVEQKNIDDARPNTSATRASCTRQAPRKTPTWSSSVDAPTDITRITYGGRLYNRAPKAHIDLLHSFDGGKTWQRSYSLDRDQSAVGRDPL